MAFATSAEFVKVLTELRLLEVDQLLEATGDLLPRFPEPRALARELVQRNWLTPFQINQLFQGRAQELVLGQYLLLERLGEGGMSQVFKARHRSMSRIVALKVIHKERLNNPDAVSRFYREIKAAAQLSHPNVVIAYDADQVGETHFFAMECVEGTDLSKLVKKGGPVGIEQACDCIRQAALGLQHAHERGLIHRDIKPSNLMLTTDGVVKVLDLGLARFDGSERTNTNLTQVGTVVGTPDYLAPEQALNARSADARADLYSLGCTFYFLLTGKPPFRGSGLSEILMKHQLEQAPPLEQLRPEVPARVRAIVNTLMAKKPEDRYQTAAELVAALDALKKPAPRPREKDEAVREKAPPRPGLSAKEKEDGIQPAAAPARVGVAVAPVRQPIIARPFSPPPSQRRWPLLLAVGLVLLAGGVALGLYFSGLLPGFKKTPDPPLIEGSAKDKDPRNRERERPDPPNDKPPVPGPSQPEPIHPPTLVYWPIDRPPVVQLPEPIHAPALRWMPIDRPPVVQLPEAIHAPALVWMPIDRPVEDKVAVALKKLEEQLAHVKSDKAAIKKELLAIRLQHGGTDHARRAAALLMRLPSNLDKLDPKKIPTGSRFPGQPDELVAIWDQPRFKGDSDAEKRFRQIPWYVTFSLDGHYVAWGSPDEQVVKVVDTASLRMNWLQGLKDKGQVTGLAFSPDNNLFAAGSAQAATQQTAASGAARLWDVKKTAQARPIPLQHGGPVWWVAFSPNGRLVATASADKTVRIWDTSNNKELIGLVGHTDSVFGVAFTGDGKTVLSTSEDKTVRVWDVDSGKERFGLTGHTDAVWWVALSSDNRTAATGGRDKTVRLWDLPSGKERAVLTGHVDGVAGGVFTPDGKVLATADQKGRIVLWDPESGNRLHHWQLPDVVVHGLAYAPDGRHLAAAINNGAVYLFRWSPPAPLDTSLKR
jgi:serine/threonine protein kinase